MISNFIRRIDMYGSKIDLNFKKMDSYKTVFGGIITITIYFIFLLGCWFFGRELIIKEKPMVINQIRTVQQPEKVNINSNQLIFTIGIQTNGTVIDDPTIFTIKGYQEHLKYEEDQLNHGNMSKKLIRNAREMEKCSPDNIKIDELKEYFLEKAELQKTYCFKDQQSEEISMEGDYDSDQFSQVYVFVEKCQNSTSNIICKPIEEINQKLQESIVTMYLSDKMITPTDYENPFYNKGINLYSLISSKIQKEIQLHFSNYYIETDYGVLYEQIQYQKNFVFAEMKESLIQSDSNLLVRVLLRMQKQKEYLMLRRYQKIADIVAQIGGLLKLLTTIGSLLSYPFAKLYLRKAIVDEVFNFEFNQKKANKIKKQRQNKNTIDQFDTNVVQKNIKDVIDMSSFFLKDNSDSMIQKSAIKLNQTKKLQEKEVNMQKYKQSILEGIKSIFTITKQNIKYKFLHYFGHIFFPKCNLKRKLVEQSVQKILEKLDVLYILNKLLEVDKLKHLLLNSDQLNLFEFIPRPVISEKSDQILNDNLELFEEISPFHKQQQADKSSGQLYEKQKKLSYFQGYSNEKEETRKALDAYQSILNILKKKAPSDTDETLIKLIDPKIVNPFQICITNQEIMELNKSNISMKSSYINDLGNDDTLNYSFKLNSIFIPKPSPFMDDNNYFQKKNFSKSGSNEISQLSKENIILKSPSEQQ